jgi:hypothetical protein
VGRFVRVRSRGETASVFLPSVPQLLGYAAELEAERDHVLARRGDGEEEERELAEAQRRRDTPDQLDEAPFKALEASAHFDRALYDGGEFGTSAEEDDFLGLPGLLEPDQVTLLLRKRKATQVSVPRPGAAADGAGAPGGPAGSLTGAVPAQPGGPYAAGGQAATGPGSSAHAAAPGVGGSTRENLSALRKELNGLVTAWNHRTGQPHAVIHADLRRACGGPAVPQATGAQIRERIELLRRWAAARR